MNGKESKTLPALHNVVLIYAPFGRDAEVLAAVMRDAEIYPLTCLTVQSLCDAMNDQVLTVVLTEEALAEAAEQIITCLSRQSSWSDLPLIMLSGSHGRAGTQERWTFLQQFGNLTVLERPLASPALIMALKAANRARSWQYVVRDQLRQLVSQAADLEKRVEERTKSLRAEVLERERIENILHEARRLEAIGRLTGGVAHDFNNLLQVITVSSALLRHVGQDEARAGTIIATIEQAVERASSLTHKLLAFGRRQALSSNVLDLRMHLSQIKELLQQSLREKIELKIEFAPSLWTAKVDTTQLDVALLNLILNAKDVMPAGGKVIISIRNVTLPSPEAPPEVNMCGDFICLSVIDDGPGMPDDVARQAFDPFFTTKPIGEGSGMGLSQVYGFAKQSGGDAWITTGQFGTDVSVLIPRSIESEISGVESQSKSESPIEKKLAGMRILYVEDDNYVAEVTSALLKEFGCSVVRACNADDALASDMGPIDIVFSDVLMPGTMDGIEMSKQIMKRHPKLPIVLASGYVMDSDRLHDLDVIFLKKPYATHELQQAMLSCLS